MRKAWKILFVVVVAGVTSAYLFIGTPHFGPKLTLKDAPVTSIELSMFSTNTVIKGSNECAQVLQTMRKARSGHVLTTPPLGSLTLYFADGTTNRFYLQPGRFSQLDLVDQSGSHSISLGEMFDTLERVGLLIRPKR